MATTTAGLELQRFLEPQLLKEFKNYKDDFIGTFKAPNKWAIDTDGIRFNKLINNVGFHVNKSSEFTAKPMTGEKTFAEWDKLDTDPTSITDVELRGLTFDKNSEVRKEHVKSFKIGVRDYALQQLAAPRNIDGKLPLIRTSGANEGNRKRLTYNDLITFLTRLETLNLPDSKGIHMILCPEHRADLLADMASTNNYRDLEIDKATGQLSRFFKINFFENNQTVAYDAAGELKSSGAVLGATDQKASVFYYAPNTVYHIEKVKVLYSPMEQDTKSADPTATIRLHTYGICDKRQNHGFGGIISANV